MKTFTAEFRELHQHDDDITRVEETLAKLQGWLVTSIDGRALSPVSKLPAKLFDLLQVGLRRTIELAEAAVREMNGGNVVVSYVLVRATFETACLMLDASRLAKKTVAKNDIALLNDVDKFLMDVLVGFKSKGWGFSEEYIARNVLTIIQRLSKELDIELMWYYEGLCEYAHPNYFGMLGTYQTPPPPGEFVVQFGSPSEERLQISMKMVIGALAMGLEMMALALTNQDEVMPAFVDLCERDIHQGGTWPKGLEYPIKR